MLLALAHPQNASNLRRFSDALSKSLISSQELMQCGGLCRLLPHKNTLVTRTIDGHCFRERTKFLRTNEIFRK